MPNLFTENSVLLEMTKGDFDFLSLSLGTALAFYQDMERKIFVESLIRLISKLNEGNPEWSEERFQAHIKRNGIGDKT